MTSKKQKTDLMQSQSYLTGQILVAMPQMQDSRFKKTVVFICGHDEYGAMGIVLNKFIESVTLDDLLEQLDLQPALEDSDIKVHYGGPVEIGRGFVLHSSDYLGENSVEITPDIALSASTNILSTVLDGTGPDHFLLALGYAGWSSGQLENEIMQNGWLTLPAEDFLFFEGEPTTLWQRTLEHMGVDPDHLFAQRGNA